MNETRQLLMGLVVTVAVSLPYHNATASSIDLGAADGFAVLAMDTITFAGSGVTHITGDIGLSPGTSMPGIPENLSLIGVNHWADGNTKSAQAALASAYTTAAGLTAQPGNIWGGAYDLGGSTLAPGVYKAVSFDITGILTLSSDDPNAIWVFQTTETVKNHGVVQLQGHAQAGNVYWQVGSSATLLGGSSFAGTIMAYKDITAVDGATVVGRLLAGATGIAGAVTMDNNEIVTPIPEPGTLRLFGIGIAMLGAFRRRFLSLV